ncbi:TetR/AcrR family transcriptional regulator [Marinobacter sp. 1Y8]
MTDLQKRREQEKQRRHFDILDAAEKVFAEKGYDRTSMDDIARTANLSRALLYVYFKDKAAIQHGIMLRAGDALRGRFADAMASAGTGLEIIRAMGRSYYHFWEEEPDYFDALTKAATVMEHAAPEQAEQMNCCENETMNLMIQAIQTGLEDGSMNAERISDPLQTALYLRGALHGVVMMCQQEMGEAGPLAHYPRESLINYSMEMLTQSIKGN